MSAWIVNRNHLDLLLTAALAWDLAVPEQADEIGRMLWAENLASVAYRYPDDSDGDRPGPLGFHDENANAYWLRAYPGPVDPEVVATAATSLAYQSCEHPAWATSRARAWTTRLREEATTRIGAHIDRHGPIDPARRAPGEHGWYISIDEHQHRHVTCGDGWDVQDRGVFTRAAALRSPVSPNHPSALPAPSHTTRRASGGAR